MNTMKTKALGLISVLSFLLLAGCAHSGKSVSEQRAAIQDMKNETLQKLYSEKPSTRSQINSAAGYAVFSNANVNLILASFGGGYGVVQSPADATYMKMAEVGVGLGAGVKDFRVVFVFHDADTMQRFIYEGWNFGGQADAAAKAGDKGKAVGGEVSIDNVTIYQMTESGIALQATLKGTKYWKDDVLN